MIIMNVEINNFYCFKNFKINFSYKKRIPTSLIENEYIEDHPNFRFKRVNVLMGCNASGKTAFGKMLLGIVNFIKYKNEKVLLKGIANHRKKASFRIDFVIKQKEGYFLYSLECEIKDKTFNSLKVNKVSLNLKDSYEKAILRLLRSNKNYKHIVNKVTNFDKNNLNNEEDTFEEKITTLPDEMVSVLNEINFSGWFFCFPDDEHTKNQYDLTILNYVLKTFDNSIQKVEKVKNAKNGYLIYFDHGKNILIQDGKVPAGSNMLSSGTKEGINIAYAITSMKDFPDRPFYIDEKFSHVHTEIEKSILSLMIDIVGKENQLFFTTHNLDLLEMSLPTHSYVFLGKNNKEIQAIYPENIVSNKNDRNLKNYVKNNVFNTIPDVTAIENLREIIFSR